MGVLTADHTRPQPVLDQVGQAVPGRLDRFDHQRRAMLEVGPAGACGEAEIGQIGIGVSAQPVVVTPRQGSQGLGERAERVSTPGGWGRVEETSASSAPFSAAGTGGRAPPRPERGRWCR